MKKNLKFILFSFILILFCPFVFSACDETKFEDVPYGYSSADAINVISEFNDAGRNMVSELNLKLDFETTNIYTFYNSVRSKTQEKVVKDVIRTSIGNENTGIITVKKTRYINNVKQTELTSSYVKTVPEGLLNEVWYCYTNLEDSTGENVVNLKDRNEYPNSNQMFLKFFDSVIFQINPSEIASIYEKTFEEQVYYKLTTGVTSLVEGVSGLETVNDRFSNYADLFTDPQLFKIMDRESKDAVENYFYECSKDSSTHYAKYFVVGYNLTNLDREKYLNVSSTTRLLNYGDNVSLNRPDDVNEYTANSFMKTMQNDASYITYYTQEEEDEETGRTLFSVAKMGDNYSVKKEDYISGAVAETTYYYIVSVKTEDSEEFSAFEVKENLKEIKKVNFNLDLLNFNFNLPYDSKNTEENNYQFGEDNSYTTINFVNESVNTITSNNTTLYVNSYGKDYSSLSTRFITSIDGYKTVTKFSDEV